MNAAQTKRIALSLAVATPSIMQSLPASAATAPPAWSPPAAAELNRSHSVTDARQQLLDAMIKMSAEQKQSVGGERLILAGNFAAKSKNSAGCATHGIWCRGGQWSNGCTCAVTRRIVAKPKPKG